MTETEESTATAAELLLREPEIVAWLGERRLEPEPGEQERDDEPPRAA